MSGVRSAFYIAVGRRIQRLRVDRGLTQEQLGSRLAPQLTRASIANIESAKQRLLAHTLAQIAEVLETTCDELVKERSVPVHEEIKQRVEAQLQDRLNLSPERLLKLTRKLGLDEGQQNDATAQSSDGTKGRGNSN